MNIFDHIGETLKGLAYLIFGFYWLLMGVIILGILIFGVSG